MSNPQHHTQHHTQRKIEGELPMVVGTEAWHAQRWRAQWAALGDAFVETEAQIQKHKKKLDEPSPLAKDEKERLCGALRLILDPPPGGAGVEAMKALGIFVNSPLVIQETQQPKATDDVLQQYYIPATFKKQVMLLEKLRVFAETVFPFFYHGFYPLTAPSRSIAITMARATMLTSMTMAMAWRMLPMPSRSTPPRKSTAMAMATTPLSRW